MRSRAIIGIGVLCLALVACHRLSEPPTPAESQEAAPAQGEVTPPQPPKPPRKPPVPPSPPETAKAEPAEREPPKPESLIGLDQPATEALLGEPSERAEAAPATIWRYTGRSCQLEIYFYLDLKSQIMRALHYEVKTHEAAESARSRCFADLVAEHDSSSGSNPPN